MDYPQNARTPHSSHHTTGAFYAILILENSPILKNNNDTQPAPPLPFVATFPLNWIEVPQRNYGHGLKQRCFQQLDTVSFSVGDRQGINMGDALRKVFVGLNGRDDPVLQDTARAISCRFLVGSSGFHEVSGADSVHPQFPGYPGNGGSCQVRLLRRLRCHVLTSWWKIHTRDWTKQNLPITRSKLAHEVAKKLEQYLRQTAVRSHRNQFNFAVAHWHITETYSG